MQQGSKQRPSYILECKKASPSKGLIRAAFDLTEIAEVYQHYATVISVLTDEKYFQGHFADIAQVRQRVTQPILCKDFILSEYQVYLARYAQADAILLMLSVLNDERYTQLATLAHQLGMGVLTETSNEAEFARALALKAKVIGVNNRNLHKSQCRHTTCCQSLNTMPIRFLLEPKLSVNLVSINTNKFETYAMLPTVF